MTEVRVYSGTQFEGTIQPYSCWELMGHWKGNFERGMCQTKVQTSTRQYSREALIVVRCGRCPRESRKPTDKQIGSQEQRVGFALLLQTL